MTIILMLTMLQVHRGVKGLVKDSSGKPVEGATVIVLRKNDSKWSLLRKSVTTSSRGEFWRLLIPREGSPQDFTWFAVAAKLNDCHNEGTVISFSPFQVGIFCILKVKLRNPGVFSEQGTTFKGNPTGA